MKLFIYIGISIFMLTGLNALTAKPLEGHGRKVGVMTGPEGITYTDATYLPHIKTVEMYRSGWRLSPPILNLRDTASLILEFDDLADETSHYTYTLIHCTSDWQPSDLVNTQYLVGLPENEIRNFRYSRNALQNYKHYRLSFPNEEVRPKLPGNYLMFVYNNFNQEEPVLTRRFFIVDPLVQIVSDIHRTDNLNYLMTHQEVDFNVDYQLLQPDDPRRNFKVAVYQNLNWSAGITGLLPKYMQPGELIYNYEEENLFRGGTEFLHFDTKSLKFNSDRIREIRFEYPLKHVSLLPDRPKALNTYEYQEDLNGKYLVKWDDAFDSDTEADYVMVHFYLQTGDSLPDTDIFLFGGLSAWQLHPDYQCRYNPASLSYEVSVLLKQGYYNYAYATRNRQDQKVNLVEIDGNHFETENDYYIFVYYRDIRERFDRLVGLQIANSVKLPGK